MAQPKKKPEPQDNSLPAPGHNNPPAVLDATENVTFDGITLDAANKEAVKAFVHGAVKLWRQGNRAIHLAAAVAIYHAQQYGDPSLFQNLHDQFDEDSEKALRSGLRSWAGKIATVLGKTEEVEGVEVVTPDKIWLSFSTKDGFKVKSKSQEWRKDNMTLAEIIDTPPFYSKAHGEEKTFDFTSFLKFLKGLQTKAEGQAEKSHIDGIPQQYLKPLQLLANMAEQDLAAVTVSKTPITEILAQRNK